MARLTVACLTTLAAAQSALGGTFFFVEPRGEMPTGEPNVVVSVWDFGIDMEDPDFWLSTSFDASILAGTSYGFTNIRSELQPPPNPLEVGDDIGTFFSTAQQYPNNLTFEGATTYSFDFASASSRTLSVSWQSGSEADGIGPHIVLFRMAIERSAGAPALSTTETPGAGGAVVSFSGQTFTNLLGGLEFDLALYPVPEPSAAILLLAGLAAMSARRRSP